MSNYGLVLTKSPGEGDCVQPLFKLTGGMLDAGHTVTWFLFSDAVWMLKKGPAITDTHRELVSLKDRGVEIIVCRESMEARGLRDDEVVISAEVTDDTYGRLVDLVMEEWDNHLIV